MSSISFPNRKQVIIVGFPRSGNTYISRLLGTLLNAPVTGAYNAKPLAEEGLNRKSDYVVRQLHLQPKSNCTSQQAIASGWIFCTNNWKTERIIHIVRDPRDVTVSAHFYWKRKNLTDTIRCVAEGKHPIPGGCWSSFVDSWSAHVPSNPHIYEIRFRDLIEGPHTTLQSLLEWLDEQRDTTAINNALSAQSMTHKREQITRDGDSRPYGKSIQLHHLRKGIIGDWRNHFNAECIDLAHSYWQTHLIHYGFEKDDTWFTGDKNT
jgi:hypothetical protein